MIRYSDSMKDIKIAQEALRESLLTKTVLNGLLLCDVYVIPAHNHQAFYLQVYKGENYTLLYAKTLITDFLGNNIVMYTFEDSLRARNHSSKKGAIYCGIKHLPLDDPTIKKLLECLPTKSENCLEDNTIIDGVRTIIRNHQYNTLREIAYCDSSQIKINEFSHDQAEFLNELYMHFEQVIGNLLDYI